MSKLLLLTSGGDWADADAVLLVVPAGRSIEDDAKLYPGYRESGNRWLEQWLQDELGYREPTEDEAVSFHIEAR